LHERRVAGSQLMSKTTKLSLYNSVQSVSAIEVRLKIFYFLSDKTMQYFNRVKSLGHVFCDSLQHYVIKFVSDSRQVSGFL